MEIFACLFYFRNGGKHMRLAEGKTYKEIAEALSISESDVKVTLFRARNELKEKILQKKSLFL